MNKPFCVWITGLSGVGKTTLARGLAAKYDAEVVDGDALRAKSDLGESPFSKEARDRNVAFAAREARSILDSGKNVVVSLISPYEDARNAALKLLGSRTVLVWLHATIESLSAPERDTKQLYQKCFRGEISHLTGVDDPYEAPLSPDICVLTHRRGIGETLELVSLHLERFLREANLTG